MIYAERLSPFLASYRSSASVLLESLGMQVLEAARAAEAIQTTRSHPGTIDWLLSDIEMPDMSGGINLEEGRNSKQKLAGSSFLQKSFSLKELRTALTALFPESETPHWQGALG